jgi:hypothetical protein
MIIALTNNFRTNHSTMCSHQTWWEQWWWRWCIDDLNIFLCCERTVWSRKVWSSYDDHNDVYVDDDDDDASVMVFVSYLLWLSVVFVYRMEGCLYTGPLGMVVEIYVHCSWREERMFSLRIMWDASMMSMFMSVCDCLKRFVWDADHDSCTTTIIIAFNGMIMSNQSKPTHKQFPW